MSRSPSVLPIDRPSLVPANGLPLRRTCHVTRRCKQKTAAFGPKKSGEGVASPGLREEAIDAGVRQATPGGRGLVAAAGSTSSSAVVTREIANETCTRTMNQIIREGHYEADLVRKQAEKEDAEQPSIASLLPRWDPSTGPAEVCIVGCGPAGLALAGELAALGVDVALVGRDLPFTNNYGVWKDEFRALGLEHTLEVSWEDAICYFGEGREVRVGRGYGRVCRRRLRDHLLKRCVEGGVRFLPGEVARIESDALATTSTLHLQDGTSLRARLVTVAAGAAAAKFLRYEAGAPLVAAQTAYGIEAEVEGYGEAYDPQAMLFMDFRRHHSGVWDGTAPRLQPGLHPAGQDGLWGTDGEVPSFLYAMPLRPGVVFLEETCLVARPALPFATLKRRLERRLRAMGVKVTRVIEEEWSYIPVGGPLPLPDNNVTAFGAAANLVHPATGYSIARSLREAPQLAADMAEILRANVPARETAARVWEALWPDEKRRQAAFHLFGMELLVQLDLASTNSFFTTFFQLPDLYWRGFLASSLSSQQLVTFALLTFLQAPFPIKLALMRHLLSDPAGAYLVRYYLNMQARSQDDDTPASHNVLPGSAVGSAT